MQSTDALKIVKFATDQSSLPPQHTASQCIVSSLVRGQLVSWSCSFKSCDTKNDFSKLWRHFVRVMTSWRSFKSYDTKNASEWYHELTGPKSNSMTDALIKTKTMTSVDDHWSFMIIKKERVQNCDVKALLYYLHCIASLKDMSWRITRSSKIKSDQPHFTVSQFGFASFKFYHNRRTYYSQSLCRGWYRRSPGCW